MTSPTNTAQSPSEQDGRSPLKITFVGHVDHGKSTLVGRLLHDIGALPEGKADAIKAMCEKRGMPFEWAFLMDALQAERDQGITIDTARIWFKTAKRDYMVIDAPGHKEFLKNMVTGAASADAALLVIDANEGVREQTRRHGYLLHLLGVQQVVAVVNKMDLVGYSQDRFDVVEADLRKYLSQIGVSPLAVIPTSGRDGENMAAKSAAMPWYSGPNLIEAIDGFNEPEPAKDLSLFFPVQDVYKFDDRRIIAGRVEQGVLRVGDTLRFSPSGKTAKVESIETWASESKPISAGPGQSIGVTLDEQIFVERGDVAVQSDHIPIEVKRFKARVFWLDKEPLAPGKRYTMKMNTGEQRVEVTRIEKIIDATNLEEVAGEQIERNAVAEVELKTRNPVTINHPASGPQSNRFVLVDGYRISGGGLISVDQAQELGVKSKNITTVKHMVSADSRIAVNGHRGGILWLTGLSGSGKSTVAIELERQLHRKGFQTYVLDGDNVRGGLNRDLGFSPEDRTENIRRIGEVAGLFADAGMIVITAFISPYQADRNGVRAIRPEKFNEVYIKADLETCESRDPKGLYKKARAGEIPEFTGISAPYEPPEQPEIVVDTAGQSVDESVADLIRFIENTLVVKENVEDVA